MNYNIIGQSNCSELGLGFNRQDANNFTQSQMLVDYAISHGINYFEACTFYLQGRCEEIVGKALSKYPRDSFLLCDKFSIPDANLYDINHLEEFFQKQLQKCQVHYFDFYLLQAVDKQGIQKIKENPCILQFFRKKKEEGLIKQFGFSFHDTNDVLLEAIDLIQPDCVQIQLNYYDWYLGVAKDLYFTLRDKNIPIFVMCALKGGTIVNQLPAKIRQDFYSFFPELNLAELGFDFLRNLSGVKMVLTGAERIDWLEQNIKIYDKPFKGLTKQEQMIIQVILDNYKKYSLIKCTGCGYCSTVCPRGVHVPEFIACYNQIMSGNDTDGKYRELYYQMLKQPGNFFTCMHCGRCENKCPQHLPIRQIINNTLFPFKL